MTTIKFVTTNEGKVNEAQRHVNSQDFEAVSYNYTEIQSTDLGAIALRGAEEAFNELGGPLLVEDSGLFIEALDGFPGPYSSYAQETIGIDEVAELARRAPHQRAFFRTALVFYSNQHIKTFTGEVEGVIVQPRGKQGFAYDPIFEVDGKTMAERSPEEKNTLSHRGRALDKFANWLSD